MAYLHIWLKIFNIKFHRKYLIYFKHVIGIKQKIKFHYSLINIAVLAI